MALLRALGAYLTFCGLGLAVYAGSHLSEVHQSLGNTIKFMHLHSRAAQGLDPPPSGVPPASVRLRAAWTDISVRALDLSAQAAHLRRIMYGLYLSLILFAGGLIVSFVGSRSVAATAGPSNRRWVIGMFCAANVAVFLSLTVLPGVGRTFDSSFWTPPGQNEFEADLGNLVLRMSHDMGWHHAIGATVVSLAASITAFFWAFRITAKSARTAEQSGEPEPPIKRDLKS